MTEEMMVNKKKNSRAKANRLVSKYLTEMATIQDATIEESNGEVRLCARAEKLAHVIWKNTLGFTELDVKSGLDIIHAPSLSWLRVLLERMEGKVQDVSATKTTKSLADRVKATTKSKLNKMAEDSVE
jgi:hypothetical protein